MSNALTHGAEPLRVEIDASHDNALARVVDAGLGLPEGLAEYRREGDATVFEAAIPRACGL